MISTKQKSPSAYSAYSAVKLLLPTNAELHRFLSRPGRPISALQAYFKFCCWLHESRQEPSLN